ncbi:MAG: response regulator [Chthoniobacter sp.]|nr:response regulator [Chthoniobacter sp.]
MVSELTPTLLVEDNPEHVEFLRKLFATPELSHFHLTVVDTLAAALAWLKTNRAALILLDLTLPDSDGLETFLRVFEAAPQAALVVLSGTNDVGLAIETVQFGAQDYLVKGRVDNQLLMRSMAYALERKRAQSALQQAHDALEARVGERTAELEKTNTRLLEEVAERGKAEEALRETNARLSAALTELRAAQEEIVQRERMLALGRMANGIAHDFNNALAPILGFSELLLIKPETLADTKRARNYLEMIHSAAKSSARVVSRLREFYRFREPGEVLVPVALNEVVRHVLELTQPRWKDQALAEGVTIEIHTDLGEVPEISANEAELREILVSLIFNAADAIRQRGTITIRTEVRDGRFAVLTVTDDGVGMSEEIRAHCLEPFYSTKVDRGAGLGLGSVYGVVRRHQGQIEIRSALGAGTTVTVSFPLTESAATAPAAPAPDGHPEGLRILVVEDEDLVREVLEVYLTEDHHTVTTAVNGRDGLEKFRAGTFDLVMTDRSMPEMNGDALAAEIKKLNPRQPVLLLTGFGDLMNNAGERPPGIDLVVTKPFTLTTLRAGLAEVRAK